MRTIQGVGIGYRRELAHALLARPSSVDFVEVVAEACRDSAQRREAAALAEIWPVVPHGVKLSLGSAEGIDPARARELGRLARELRAPLVSEHVSFVRAGGREIGHLTELPMTREAVNVVARNVMTLRRALPDVPLLLENVARAFVWPEAEHEMDEGTFHAEIVLATGCDLLLDAGNLYANALNSGRDPFEVLASYPLERVAMLHVAGGVMEHGFYFDTHAHPVPSAVFELVARLLAQRDVPVILERDAGYDDHVAILDEVARLRDLPRALPPVPVPVPAPAPAPVPARAPALGLSQAALADALTRSDPEGLSTPIVRARTVLERKRADDALPLLPELSARLAPHDALTLGRIPERPRLATMTAVADAMAVAEAARAVPDLARFALRDSALLRARFEAGPDGPRPRTMPYVGRERTSDGAALWVLKGFGQGAPVRLIERGARR